MPQTIVPELTNLLNRCLQNVIYAQMPTLLNALNVQIIMEYSMTIKYVEPVRLVLRLVIVVLRPLPVVQWDFTK